MAIAAGYNRLSDARPMGTDKPLSRSKRIFWKCHIGRRIRLCRETFAARTGSPDRTITRSDVARELDITPSMVWEIEYGISSVDGATLLELAECLQVHPGTFFDFQGPVPAGPTADQKRLINRLTEIVPTLSSGEFTILETVFRYFLTSRTRVSA